MTMAMAMEMETPIATTTWNRTGARNEQEVRKGFSLFSLWGGNFPRHRGKIWATGILSNFHLDQEGKAN